MVVFSFASLYFLSHTHVTCVIFNVFPLLQMGRPTLTAPLAEVDRAPLPLPAPPNTNPGQWGPSQSRCPARKPAAPYLVTFWNLISLGADRGRMTSMESRVKVKRWSAYQGCRAGRRKSHTGGKAEEGGSQ